MLVNNQELLDNLEGTEIAVVGMSGRFPGAQTIDAYWQNLRDGVESVTRYSDDELRAAGVDEASLRNPNYVKSGAHLDNMELFDAGFFGFSPRDAAILDPQHRQFMECCWEALEYAGYDPTRFDGPIGVFGGSGHNIYLAYNLLTNPQLVNSVGFFLLRHTGNDKDFLTTRVSYQFDLKGPSVNVQTACSTSLVAIHLAAQSLLSGECDMALAGGVTINLPHRQGYLYQEGEILSSDGHCRAFDAASDGTIFGSGAGVVLLRRLSDAIEAGDTIHAVILGSAINNDGAGKVNYLAPSIDGQAAAVAEAITLANVPPETITYIETHGTGTRIGDPIEITALTQAFRAGTTETGFCGIGSVKTNIGHLDTAAGVAGFIKTVLALKHRQLPPSLNFTAPNPMIDFAASPFYVNAALADWATPNGAPRRAAVNSLGVGGTNAHVVLEETPHLQPSGESRSWQLLLLSAKSAAALEQMTANLAAHLQAHPAENLADAAYTLQVGRQQFEHRRALVCRSAADGAAALETLDRKRLFSGSPGEAQPSLVFMFPGGGAQYPNMGRELYEQEPVYRAEIDRCLALLKPQLDVDLRTLLFPAAGQAEVAAVTLERPSLALPALFMAEYALAQLWLSWGVQPTALIGHSMGEYTAACLAGVLSVEDALSIVTLRGKLFETLPEGGMLSVSLPEAEVRPLLVDGADIAVINSPELCVVSGPVESINRMETVLTDHGADYRRIKIAVAAHSPMLEPMLAEFGQRLAAIRFNPPTIPFISNITGNWITPQEATDPAYWVKHLRHTVRFADGLAALLKDDPRRVLLEVGPGQTLSGLARMHPDFGRTQTTLASMRHPRDESSDLQFLLTALGKLWLAGLSPDWVAFYQNERRYRVPLPTYPFEHQRHWIEPGRLLAAQPEPETAALKKSENLDDWFYQPVWRQVDLPATANAEPQTWLVFCDELGLGDALVEQLQADGQRVVRVTAGERFAQLDAHNFVISPLARTDYETLTRLLVEQKLLPERLLHLWTVNTAAESRLASYYKNQDLGFNSLLFLAQTLGGEALPAPLRLAVISNGVHSVNGEPLLYPEKATLLGPVQVISREYHNIRCAAIDVSLPQTNRLSAQQIANLLPLLLTELNAEPVEPVVALRAGARWVRRFEPAAVEPSTQNQLREQGVYLITGGLGGIGLVMAGHLARSARARLVLLSRSGLPPRSEWRDRLRIPDRVSEQIQQVQALEALGAEVLPLAADVTNLEQLQAAISQAVDRFGAIHGVVHAAGVLADGLIQFKSPEATSAVLAPKVRGTLLLDKILTDAGILPDFMVLFSSTSSFLGLPGQIDYSAANAFLNAFAQSKIKPYTVAINWGMWQQVGMAVRAAREMGLIADEQPAGEPVNHPLLDSCVVNTAEQRVYSTRFETGRHWLLNEHRLRQGGALIPGTGYLELARAAFANGAANSAVEINQLSFVAPLNVADDEAKEVRTILQRDGAGYSFTVVSRDAGDAHWQEHARAELGSGKPATVQPYDIAAIAARCRGQAIGSSAISKQQAHVNFGPRWQNLKQMMFGQDEALALMELPDAFGADLAQYAIHPALMDTATAFALPLISGYADSANLYVPLSYRQVRIFGPLPQKIYSYVRLSGNITTNVTHPVFDVSILDEQGNVLVEIKEFTMMAVAADQLAGANGKPGSSAQHTKQVENSADGGGLLRQALSDGISPDEGIEAFDRILSNHASAQIIVSSFPLDQLAAQVEADYAPPKEETGGFKLSRPENLQGSYEPPRNDIEKTLVSLWEELIGIDRVGIHDDFFELGGHSLIAVRLFAKIKNMFSVSLTLSTLFEAPTIAECAALVAEEADESQPVQKEKRQKHMVLIQPKGSKPPFFCIHGITGDVLWFRDLAYYLAPEQPFYGFQARGLDGRRPPFDRIEDMASAYLEELQSLQPEGPYFLGGASLGGTVAYEMAQQLLAQGQPVGILAMFDSGPPAMSRQTTLALSIAVNSLKNLPYWLADFSKFSADDMKIRIERKARVAWKKIVGNFSNDEKYGAVEAKDMLDYAAKMPEFRQRMIETHFNAIESYQPEPYSGRITFFRARVQSFFTAGKPETGWGQLAQHGIDLRIVPGSHEGIFREPHVQILARELKHFLDKANDNL
jgi:acyl transferase domain-containing protein/thioesterase domain-containing protein